MKRIFFLIVLLFHFLQTYSQVNMQEKIDSFLCIIQETPIQSSLVDYYKNIETFNKWCYSNKRFDQIILNNKYFEIKPHSEKDSLVFRKSLMYHAHYFNKMGDINTAKLYYTMSHEHGISSNYSDGLSWFIENPLANICAKLNNYEKAIYYLKICESVIEDKSNLARLYSNLADNYLWLGDTLNTHKYYDKGLELAVNEKEYRAIQSINISKAELFLENENYSSFFKALKESQNALIRLKNYPDYSLRLSSIYELEGDYSKKTNDFLKAISFYLESVELLKNRQFKVKDREIAKIYHKIADANSLAGNFDACNLAIMNGFQALFSNKKITTLPYPDDIYNENTLVDLLKVKAEYYYFRNGENKLLADIDSALLACDLATKVNDELLLALSNNNTKYKTIEYNRAIINLAIKCSYEATLLSSKNFYKDKLNNYFSISKGIILQEAKLRNSLIIDQNAEVQLNIDSLQNLIIEYYNLKNPTDEELRNKILNVGKLNAIFSNLKIDPLNREPIKTPFLDYVIAEDEIYLRTNINSSRFFKLSISTMKLLDLKIKLDELIQNKSTEELNAILIKIREALIPFELPNLASLTIIPDDYISTIAFDLLIDNNQFLIEKFPIHYRFQNIQNEKKRALKSKLKIFSLIPEYGDSQKELIAMERSGLSRLPFAQLENEYIKSIASFDVDSEQLIEIQVLKEKLKDCDIFHFGGHALLNNKSYLVYKNKDQNINNLYSEQIEYLENSLDLICLSACETGRGEVLSGEGIKSLATSFMHSGSKSVVYSLWKVNDASTSELMKKFYQNLASGFNKDEALRRAKLDFIKEASPDHKHPYYWAGFCVNGNIDKISERKTDLANLLYAIPLLILVGIYFNNKTKQTKKYEHD